MPEAIVLAVVIMVAGPFVLLGLFTLLAFVGMLIAAKIEDWKDRR